MKLQNLRYVRFYSIDCSDKVLLVNLKLKQNYLMFRNLKTIKNEEKKKIKAC